MHIVFFARMTAEFSPLTLQTQSLGGTESSIYYLAKTLAGLGQRVTVITNCRHEAGVYDGVAYRDYDPKAGLGQTIDFAKAHPIDRLIIVRDFLAPIFPIPAKKRLFWAHDDFSALGIYPEQPNGPKKKLGQGVLRLLGLVFARIDCVVAVSQWLAQTFIEGANIPAHKLFVSPNGIDLGLFDALPPKNPHRLIYSSRPERGLVWLLTEIFPRVQAQYPAVELHIYSYVDMDRYQPLARPGVVFQGKATKAELAQALLQASIWVLPQLPHEPDQYNPFAFNAETFCIGAAESQCARAVPVSSQRGALPSTTIPGVTSILVPWENSVTEHFTAAFTQALVDLLTNPAKREAMGRAGREYALTQFDWARIGQEFLAKLEAL